MRPLVPLALCWLLLLLLSDYYSFFPFSKSSHLSEVSQEKVISFVTLLENPQKNNESYKVIAQVHFEKMDDSSEAHKVQLKYSEEAKASLGDLQKGDVLKCFVKWKPAPRYKNPGTPDYKKNLERQKIFLTASAYEAGDCTVEEKGSASTFSAFVLKIQNRIRHEIEAHLSPPSAKFIKALVLGDRSDFQKEDWDLFQKTGTTHLIAVSGLHLAIVGSVFYFLILFFLKRSERFLLLYSAKACSLFLALIPTALFVVMSGNAISAWRAWMMGALLSIAFVFERDHDHWSSLALAFFVTTFLSPALLFSISFQLSFLAVLGLLLSLRYMPVKGFWKKTCLVSISIFLTTFACVALHFHMISLSGIVHNLWAIPYTNVLLMLSIGLLLLESMMPISFGWRALDFLSIGFLKLLEWVGRWPFQFSFYPDQLESFVLVAVSFCIIIFLFWNQWRRECVVATAIFLLVWGHHRYQTHHQYEVCFVDVGQGDAALIRAPDHHSTMIDTGGFLIPSAYQKNVSFDVGENVLVPYLKTKGVGEIDRLILSHPHPDHFGGAESVLKNLKVKELCGNGQKFPDESFDRLIQSQSEQSVNACTLKGGDAWDWEGLHWEVVYPQNINPALNMNDNSLVIRVSDSHHSFLFSGDIEKAGEESLADHPGLQSEVMKVPHHASKTSSSVAFIDTVKPKYVVASLGENNFFGFPHADILERYQRRDAQVFRTDQDGEVCFTWKATKKSTSSPNSPNSTLSIQKFFSGR